MPARPTLQQTSATSQLTSESGHLAGLLRQEYEGWQALLAAQPASVQRFLDGQARQLADSLTSPDRPPQVRFTLPDSVITEAGGLNQPAPVPPEFREQMAGGLMDRLTRGAVDAAVRQRLAELDQSPNRAVAIAAGLVRHATAMYMVHGLLPDGRSVTYDAAEGEEIPSIPVASSLEPESAITASTDAIVEEEVTEAGRGSLLVPFVPAARRFYLPQWVAFDDEGRLLVNSTHEAEAHVASMQRFLGVLHSAVSLAPYMVADEGYQRKRYGMLGQLVNQGRSLARHETGEIIGVIRRRSAAQDLNRGLSLSLPYFDDQALQLRTHDFEVIPAGRIMFVSAFVARAARAEQAKVAQDTRLSPSTRRHLLAELKMLEESFESGQPEGIRKP